MITRRGSPPQFLSQGLKEAPVRHFDQTEGHWGPANRDAFAALVRATYDATYTLAYRLTGDEEDARDVVQETYLRAYRSIGRFRGEARVTTWPYAPRPGWWPPAIIAKPPRAVIAVLPF